MAKAYWIGRVDVSNPDAYQNYVKANAAAFSKFGAKFLVRGGQYRVAEGEARARNVVIEFPSYEAATACWDSPEYQAAKAERDGHALADIIIIEGYEGPQPG
ncbi:DUF1330 domain-containing protein [Microvirga guangxiensis]|uniref:Uncharacterized conserved protein, DUF1330 family n=1 Tax=Microvirga guangxiensis TaxID=549386 RepID=A0A1G5F9X1_9HYPH|nr:DUF1330 domain-containing protein [Microvirga guangxiensis]SCY35997.1 Uncharacterized conserved protein, DUF1330 family [Microvirga guangxiensis]